MAPTSQAASVVLKRPDNPNQRCRRGLGSSNVQGWQAQDLRLELRGPTSTAHGCAACQCGSVGTSDGRRKIPSKKLATSGANVCCEVHIIGLFRLEQRTRE